jgi:7,8-dihydroneopterin aldolase/epimerase/oxygenase
VTGQGTDLVEVRGLRLRGRVGVTPDERAAEQPLVISVAARLDTRRASAMDDLSETLDYEEAVRHISKIVTGESYSLVETMADRIARALLSNPSVLDVWVRISKPEVALAEEVDEVAVEISRSREDLKPFNFS